VHAQFVVDHDRLVAVVPNPDASALITTSHRWELGGGAWVAATESENDRDLYTIALDHHNSLLWTYLPLGDFLAGYAWWMVRKHAVSPYAQAELSTPFVTVQGEVDAEGAALEYDFVSSCQHVSYEQLIASNTELSIGFAGGVGAAVAPTPSDGALPPAVTPMARDSASAPVPRTLRCHLFTGDATLQRIERNSAAAIAALAAGARCEHCRDAVLLPIDAPLRAPPATDVDERGLAPDGVKREPQKPADFFWQEVRAEGDDAAAAAAPLRAVCDLCVMNVKPIKHSAHEHPLVALLPTGRLRRGYTYGWVCDLCRQSFLAHDADVMHHCADGCSFDLCSRCFWGDRATRAQAALALCHIAADQSIDVRARLAELRPALHEFDARPPKRSAVEPTNVVIAQLADLLERTLTRYHASAAASRSTFTVSAAHRELQFHLFVVKSVVQLIKVNLYELTHCQVGSLDDGLRRRVVSLLVGRMLKPLIDGDLVVAPLLATFAFDVLEVLLLGFRTLYPTPAEQIDAVALLVTLADAPYFNPFAIGECAAMRAPRGPRWLRARDTLQPRPRNQWVLRMLADMLNNVDISSWFTTARPKADKSDKAAAASTSAAAAAPATPTNETSTADIGNNNEDEGHNDDDGNNAAAAAAAAAAATTSPDGEESFLGEGGKAASTTSSESDDVPPEPLRANLRALITDLLTGHPGEVPMLPERSYVAFAIQKQFAAAAMYGNVRPFETALCDYADIMLAAAHAALSSEGIDFSGENMRHNPLAHVTVSSLLPHFIASLGTLVVSMTTPSAQAIAVKMRQLYTGISLGLTANPNMHEKYSSYALARVAHGTPNFKWLRHGISVIGTHERVIVPHVTPRLLDLYEGAMWVAARVYTQLVIGENRTPAELTSAATLTLELFANALDKSTRAVLQNLRNGELSGPRDSVDAEQEFLLRLAGLNRRPRGTHLLFAAVRAATAPPRTRAQLMAALSVAVASDTDDDEAAPDAGAIHPLDRIERGVVAVLLKHLALTTLAMQHAAALRASKGDAKGADFSALADVWQQAQRFKVWVMQQSQALASSSSDGGASSDGETGSASGGGAESTSESTTTAATATAATTSATTSATASATTAPTTTAADPVRAFLDTIIGRIALLLHLRPMAVSNAEPVVDATTAPTAATKRWRGAVSKLTGRSRLVASALPRLTSDGGDDADDDDTLDASTDEVAATPSAAATTDQAASRWNVFFGVWKKRRRLQRSPALSEKLTSEAITFLKDAPPLDILYSAIERRVERAEQREQGLRGFADLFRSSQLDGAMIQVIPCVINAFRGDAILTQTDYTTFRVLGGLDGCGSELTRPVSAAFHDLLRLMVEYGQRRLPDVLVKAVIDAFNLTVTPFDEDALVDMGLVPWLLQLARTSRSNDSVGGCAWKLLRILIHESARNGTPKVVAVAGAAGEDEDVPVQVRGACALAASAISRLLDELTESVQAIRPLKVGSAEWTARDEPISQELLVLCSCRTPGMLPLLARPRTVHVLFDAVRFGALRTKLIALRLLREVLPLTSPGALAAYEAKRLAAAAASGQAEVWSGDDDAPADEMRLLQLGVVGALLEVIGITFEASSMHCAQAIRRLVRVASAHDVFAVANAAVAVVRALVSAPLWSERMRGVLMGALASVPQLLARTGADGAAGGIGGGALALRASMTTLTDDHESVWAAVAALYVLGGARESLRLGGRVLVVPNERADRLVYHSMLHGSVTQLRDADAHVAIEDSLIDMLRIRIAYLVPLPEVLLPASLLPTVQAVMPLLSTFVGSRAVASPRGPLRTLYYQFRTAALRMLLTLCVARPEAVIDSGLLTSVAQLAINGVAERVRYRDAEAGDGGAAAAANEQTIDASVEQLQELAQSLYELLLSDKEMAIVTLRTESHQSNMAEQRKKLVMSLVPAHKLEELMRAFSVVDLNGDGELTINEIISAQNLYSGPNPARDAELRVLYERIDTENKGSIDFFQFVIMTEGLEGYAFDADDEARDEGATRKPQLMVNAPVSVAGSNDARMSKSGQQLSGDVRGPLQAYANGGDLSGALVLIEAMAEDAAPLAERVSDAVGRGAKAVLIAVERLDAINVDDDEALPFIKSTPVPVAFVATATSQRILSALDGGYSEPERDALRESTSLHDLAAVESAQTVAALRILGVADQFDEADVAELVQEFGSVTGAIGALLSRRSRQGLLQSTSFDDFQQGALAFAKRSLSTSQLAHSAANDDDAAADEDSGDESDGGCFACGAPDHIARECPQVIGEEAAAMAAAARLRAQHGARGSDDGDAADADDAANKSTAAASKGEPSYLSTFMRSDDARSTESVHKLFVDVSKVRSSVVRVERDLATHHALQAVLALLARWPAKAERSLLALGLSATQFVALLRAATDLAAAAPPALRDSLLHGSSSQLQGAEAGAQSSTAADDVAHIAMHHLPIGAIAPFVLDVLRREPQALSTTLNEIAGTLALEAKLAEGASDGADEAAARVRRELAAHSNIEFALSMLDLLSADPSLDTSPLLHIGTLDALLRCVRFSAPQHRVHAANALLRVVRQLRDAGNSKLPAAALRDHIRILHSMLQESHANDMRDSEIVLSVMSMRYAALISEFEMLAAPLEATQALFDTKVAARAGSHEDDPTDIFGMEELERDSCSIENSLECEIVRQSFPSVGSKRWVTSGKWMYEVQVGSECAQIGWANEKFRSNIARGEGVGDDAESWAYDGLRQRKWHRGWGAYGDRWKEGDIVSCYLDLDEGTMSFSLNGKSMGVAYNGIKVEGRGLRAAASFDKKLIFNLGHSPFESPQSGFQPIDDMDSLYRADLEAFRRLYYVTELFNKRDAAERVASAATSKKSPSSDHVLQATPAATLLMNADSPTVLAASSSSAVVATSSASADEEAKSPFAPICAAALAAAAAAESTCNFDIATTATVNGVAYASLTDPAAPSAGAPILYENCAVVLRDKAGLAFSPRSLYIEAQRRRFTTQCPLRIGLVFVLSEELTDEQVNERLRRFDSVDQATARRLAASAGTDESEPIAALKSTTRCRRRWSLADARASAAAWCSSCSTAGRSTHRVDMSLGARARHAGPVRQVAALAGAARVGAAVGLPSDQQSVDARARRGAGALPRRSGRAPQARVARQRDAGHGAVRAADRRPPPAAGGGRLELAAGAHAPDELRQCADLSRALVDRPVAGRRVACRAARRDQQRVGGRRRADGAQRHCGRERQRAERRRERVWRHVPQRARADVSDDQGAPAQQRARQLGGRRTGGEARRRAEPRDGASREGRHRPARGAPHAARPDVQAADGGAARRVSQPPAGLARVLCGRGRPGRRRSVPRAARRGVSRAAVELGAAAVRAVGQRAAQRRRRPRDVAAARLGDIAAAARPVRDCRPADWRGGAHEEQPERRLLVDFVQVSGRRAHESARSARRRRDDGAVARGAAHNQRARRHRRLVRRRVHRDVHDERVRRRRGRAGAWRQVVARDRRQSSAVRGARRALPPARVVAAADGDSQRPRLCDSAVGAVDVHVARAQVARRGPRHHRHRAAEAAHGVPQRLLGAAPRDSIVLARTRVV
jgi:hypothetical protein